MYICVYIYYDNNYIIYMSPFYYLVFTELFIFYFIISLLFSLTNLPLCTVLLLSIFIVCIIFFSFCPLPC